MQVRVLSLRPCLWATGLHGVVASLARRKIARFDSEVVHHHDERRGKAGKYKGKKVRRTTRGNTASRTTKTLSLGSAGQTTDRRSG